MAGDREKPHEQSAPGAVAPGSGGAAERPPLGEIRATFQHSVEMLERGIAERDYFAANYAMGRCEFQLAIYVDAAVMGPASAEADAEVTALRTLKARVEALRPLAPEGGQPSVAAKTAWLSRVGQTTPPATETAEPDAASSLFGDAKAGEGLDEDALFETLAGPGYAEPGLTDVALGPIGSYLRTRAGMTQLLNPTHEPVAQEVIDTIADLANDPAFATGFAVGAVKGTGLAIRDTVAGFYVEAQIASEITRSLTTFRHRELLARAAAEIDHMIEGAPALLGELAARWNAKGSFARGSFRGEVVAYVASQLAIQIAMAGVSSAGEAAGPYAAVAGRLGRSAELAGELSELAAEIRVTSTATREASQAAHTAGHLGEELAGESRLAARATSAEETVATTSTESARLAPDTRPGSVSADVEAPGKGVATTAGESASYSREPFVTPNQETIEIATDGNVIVPTGKVEAYARGKSAFPPELAEEYESLKVMKQTRRKEYDRNPANEERLDKLLKLRKNSMRSSEMAETLDGAGISNTPENNAALLEHLVTIGKHITRDNRLDYRSEFVGATGRVKILSTWKILDDGRPYLSTLKLIPIEP